MFDARLTQVACVHPDSKLSWYFGGDTTAAASPSINAKGNILVPYKFNFFTAIDVHVPMARSGWPKFRGDYRNTGNAQKIAAGLGQKP